MPSKPVIFAPEDAWKHQHGKLRTKQAAQDAPTRFSQWPSEAGLQFSEPLPAKPAGLSEATKLGISWIAALTLIGLTVALSVMRPRRIVASLRTVFVYLAALASAVWLTLLSSVQDSIGSTIRTNVHYDSNTVSLDQPKV